MLGEKQLRNHLSSCDLIEVHGRLWRELNTKFILKSNPDPLYSNGPVKSGARFTPRGGFKTLYLAFDRETALLEIEATFKRADGSLIDITDTPTTTLPINVFVGLYSLTYSRMNEEFGMTAPFRRAEVWVYSF